jgi:hypothetical protein
MTMMSTTIATMAAFFIRLLGVGNLEALKFNIFNQQSPRFIKSFLLWWQTHTLIAPTNYQPAP